MPIVDSDQRFVACTVDRMDFERPVVFECEGDQLLGILTCGPMGGRRGVLVVVGGPQYRAGSHRQFTLLARKLALGGFPTFRFDYRGMGDSSGSPRTFESVEADLGAAVAAFQREVPELDEIVLWGLCDGASAVMMFGASGKPVHGMIVLNPWVRSMATLARSHIRHYYPRRLAQRSFWIKVLAGDIRIGEAIASLVQNISGLRRPNASSAPHFIDGMRRGFAAFPGRVLIVLSGDDLTAREFLEVVNMDPQWQETLSAARVDRVDIPDADHTFSRFSSRQNVEQTTLSWLASW